MIGSGHDAADVYGKLNKWMFKILRISGYVSRVWRMNYTP